MTDRQALARNNELPADVLLEVSRTYVSIAEKIIGGILHLPDRPKAEIMDILSSRYNLIV